MPRRNVWYSVPALVLAFGLAAMSGRVHGEEAALREGTSVQPQAAIQVWRRTASGRWELVRTVEVSQRRSGVAAAVPTDGGNRGGRRG